MIVGQPGAGLAIVRVFFKFFWGINGGFGAGLFFSINGGSGWRNQQCGVEVF